MAVFRNAVLLMAVLLLASCATRAYLKIDEIRNCLVVGADVARVASCIEPYSMYRTVPIEDRAPDAGVPATWLEDHCGPNAYWRDCSHTDLLERVSVGAREVFARGTGEKVGEYPVVVTPYFLFYSIADNLGGPLVQIFVFYDESDNKVIGWINMGSKSLDNEFRAER